MSKSFSIIDIELNAATSLLSYEDYRQMLWSNLVCDKKNMPTVRKIAKELNVYPKPVNVYEEIINYLTQGIAI